MNGLPTDENDSPHKSEYEFEHRWQLQTDMRYGIKFRSFFRGDPNYYQRVFDPLFPHYRGLPEDCQRLQRTQSEEYLQKMQGCYTIEVLSKSYDRRTFPTYDRVKVLGNKIRFSGGTRLNKVRQEQELNRPRETYLRFFEGKKTNRIYCDNYGSFINLEESDFVNQILFEDRDGYRLRFTRINGRGQLAVTSEKKEMFSRNNNQRCCNTCGAPKPFFHGILIKIIKEVTFPSSKEAQKHLVVFVGLQAQVGDQFERNDNQNNVQKENQIPPN